MGEITEWLCAPPSRALALANANVDADCTKGSADHRMVVCEHVRFVGVLPTTDEHPAAVPVHVEHGGQLLQEVLENWKGRGKIEKKDKEKKTFNNLISFNIIKYLI
jgi:hypothetical protein